MNFAKFSTQKLYITFGLLLVLGWQLAFAEEAKKNTEQNVPQYYQLDPDLVINLKDKNPTAFLQVRIEIVAKTATDLEKIQYHEPLIRDRLITLLSAKSKAEISGSESRKLIRAEALKVVQEALTEVTGKPIAQEILFTQIAID